MPDLSQRLSTAVDVSGAFDNCFFHSYAAYLLANGLPLPDDLFTFDSIIPGEESPARRIRALLPTAESLDIFVAYHRTLDPASTSHCMMEKTLILGFLLREWFATKMANTPTIGETMLEGEQGVVSLFKGYIDFVSNGVMPAEEFDSQTSIYAPNRAFLDYCIRRSTEVSVPAATLDTAPEVSTASQVGTVIPDAEDVVMEDAYPVDDDGDVVMEDAYPEVHIPPVPEDVVHTEQTSAAEVLPIHPFETYFTRAQGNLDRAIALYWAEEGYKAYISYLARPNIKIGLTELTSVLKAIHQPFIIYNSNGSINDSMTIAGQTPLELKLAAGEGHYFLLKSAEITAGEDDLLGEYRRELARYHRDRTAVLEADDGHKKETADRSSSLFVGAICKAETVSWDPFESLLERIEAVKNDMAHRPAASRATAAGAASLAPATAAPAPTAEVAIPTPGEERVAPAVVISPDTSTPHASGGAPPTQPGQAESPRAIAKKAIRDFEQQLTAWNALQNSLEQGTPVRKIAEEIAHRLNQAKDRYVKNPSEASYQDFSADCKSIVSDARQSKELQNHQQAEQWNQILGNIALAVVGLGVLYLVAAVINKCVTGNFLFFQPKASLQAIETSVSKLAPKEDEDSPTPGSDAS